MVLFALVLATALQQQPVPRPFPRPGSAPPTAPAPPARPAPQSSAPIPPPAKPDPAPTEAALGVPVYPAAQFITSYNAGRGQRFYIFGSSAPFVDLVTFYRTVLK